MKSLRHLMVLVCCIALVAVGCGEDDNGNNQDDGNGGNGGIDTSQLISEMDDEDAQALCDAEMEVAEDVDQDALADASCKTVAYITASFSQEDQVAACEAAYDDCMNPEEEEGEGGEEEEMTCQYVEWGEEREECDATAGDSLSCSEDQLNSIITFGEEFDCADLEEGISQEAEDALNGEVESCTSYYDSCPPADPEQQQEG